MTKIDNLKPFEKMVVHAWLRRTNHYQEFGRYDYNTGRNILPVINTEKHLGKAWKIYNRWHNILDQILDKFIV